METAFGDVRKTGHLQHHTIQAPLLQRMIKPSRVSCVELTELSVQDCLGFTGALHAEWLLQGALSLKIESYAPVTVLLDLAIP